MAEKSDVNVIVVKGNVTRDGELKRTPSGTAVLEFGLANNRFAGRDNPTRVNFFDVAIWGGRAEALERYVRKGAGMIIEGEMEQHRWERDGAKRTRWVLKARDVNFAGGGDRSEAQPEARRGAAGATGTTESVIEDDVPF